MISDEYITCFDLTLVLMMITTSQWFVSFQLHAILSHQPPFEVEEEGRFNMSEVRRNFVTRGEIQDAEMAGKVMVWYGMPAVCVLELDR